MYIVRCYDRQGNFSYSVNAATLDDAKNIRTNHGHKIGLKPEPSLDFAYYPTIWKEENGKTVRLLDY